jgi:phage-related protein
MDFVRKADGVSREDPELILPCRRPAAGRRSRLPIYARSRIVPRMKRIFWLGGSKDDLLQFPPSVVDDAGYQLFRVQSGLEPTNWKPMKAIGAGVKEIRIRDSDGAFRIVYLATRPEGVYVLHCFQKKTGKTDQADIDLARTRLRLVLR